AYILVVLAIFNRLYYFIWGAAVGTHVFALGLWRLTSGYRKRMAPAPTREFGPTAIAPASRSVCEKTSHIACSTHHGSLGRNSAQDALALDHGTDDSAPGRTY